MTKKDWVMVLLAAIVIAAGYYLYGRDDYKTNKTGMAPETNQQSSGFFIGSIYATIVNYNGSEFSPSSVSIPKGGAVIFRNYSPKNMRVASNPYPSNDGYPVKDGCVGSAFDSCSNIPPKVSWSFNFDMPGTWGYHNNLNPSEGGTVTVQ